MPAPSGKLSNQNRAIRVSDSFDIEPAYRPIAAASILASPPVFPPDLPMFRPAESDCETAEADTESVESDGCRRPSSPITRAAAVPSLAETNAYGRSFWLSYLSLMSLM